MVAPLLHHRDQGHVVDEVGMHEEIDFPLGKIALCAEEAAVEGLRAGTADGRHEGVPIVRA
jgi:hypothetical protein